MNLFIFIPDIVSLKRILCPIYENQLKQCAASLPNCRNCTGPFMTKGKGSPFKKNWNPFSAFSAEMPISVPVLVHWPLY